ncbi:MAG TPA: isopentenyl-diphosphate Delta-isomerase [Xanthobacteraceae bacterium]|nr:isopentenyl-diphosphate Delta-isomerase [Xanthobacteraceae bacterium]
MSAAANENDPVVLVDAGDTPLGSAPKLETHRRGLRHRAISVLIRNSQGLMLLQRRAAGKYHSRGLWTNACCSHPRPGETALAAARRRLREEMGFNCALKRLFLTHYRGAVSDDLIENEVVHVFGGSYDRDPAPDPAEASAWKWQSLPELIADQEACPQRYTIWFLHYLRAHRQTIADWLQGPASGK